MNRKGLVEIQHRLWRHAEGISFWALALLHLVPVWAFHYLPTQDGPSHLANAQILKECGTSAAGYEAFFEVRAEPVPNWTSHLLLAGLLYVVPPLTAEKILVSLYILGFTGAYRYFIGAFGDRARPLSWLGLLFLFNRCFWMGFYNYCLSLVLVWLILGYCVRRRGQLHLPEAGVLMLLFAAAYFTHLVGFVLAVTGALAASLLVKPRSFLCPVLICLAAAPSALLTMDYLEHSGFFRAGAARRLVNQPLALLHGGKMERSFGQQLQALDQELFEHHVGSQIPLSWFLIPYVLALGGFGIAEYCRREWTEAPLIETEFIEPAEPEVVEAVPASIGGDPGWLYPCVLGFLMLGFYLLLPNDLGSGDRILPHGGYLKARLALLPPLVWLACFREPAHIPTRFVIRWLTALLLGVNLFFVMQTFRAWNTTLQQYTAGIEAVGCRHRLFPIQADGGGRLVNPLLHAADYYCLGTDNINLDNYEASTAHFPIKYRRGVTRGPNRDAADVLMYWRTIQGARLGGWEEIFTQGPLRIFRRAAP